MDYEDDGFAWVSDYTSAMYGGAPDECNLHWPKKPHECGCDDVVLDDQSNVASAPTEDN